MLTLALRPTANPPVVSVFVNDLESHTFPIAALALNETQVDEFYANPSGYGQRLYTAIFPEGSQARQALHNLTPGSHLVFQPHSRELGQVPWEYLFDGSRYLAAEYALLRNQPGSTADPQVAAPARLRFLFVPADPLLHGSQPAPYRLGIEQEWLDLRTDLTHLDPGVDLFNIQPPTFLALQDALAGVRSGLVHFTGHGISDKTHASLVFELPSGASDLVQAAKFAALVRGKAALVVLSACQSAAPGQAEEANLAALLSAQGIPFVLGMQLSVPDHSARVFTDKFYRYLFSGEDVYEAVRQARLALLQSSSVLEMGIAVLYAANPQASGQFCPTQKGFTCTSAPSPTLEGLPQIESNFEGRQRELAQIGALLTAERPRDGQGAPPLTVTLHGPGGIGKTALLMRAATRFAWAFEGVLAQRLEPLPDPESLCERMEKLTSLPEGSLLPRAERLERLATHLSRKRLLLALDNFESLVHARDGGEPEKKAGAFAIFKFLRSLPARGVTLLVSSRVPSGLPGEKSVEVPGLDEHAGARLFAAWISERRADLQTALLRRVSRRVGGHPLALRLLAPRFDRDAGLDLAAFEQQLASLLPAAADEWGEGQRHDTLQACFDFSLRHLQAAHPALVQALAQLSVFDAAFPAWLAAPVLLGMEAVQADEPRAIEEAARILHQLWEFGQLEREVLPLGTQALSFYNLHPALHPFAAARLTPAQAGLAGAAFFEALSHLGQLAYPASAGGGVFASYPLAVTARRALPDLRRAAGQLTEARGANLRYHTAFLLRHFGDLEGAMSLYRQSLEIIEGLGDLQGKSATLHEMAYILRVRGDLEGAMSLYRQSLEIIEGLGDLQGKSATLHEMAYILRVRGDLEGAMSLYRQSLEIKEGLGDLQGKSATLAMLGQLYAQKKEDRLALQALLLALQTLQQIGARPDAQAVADILVQFSQSVGPAVFNPLWAEVTQGAPLPAWLQPGQPQEQGLPVEAFIAAAVEAALQRQPAAEDYFKKAAQLASDPAAPAPLRTLGRVLRSILSGERSPDLSQLPPDLAEAVRRALQAGSS